MKKTASQGQANARQYVNNPDSDDENVSGQQENLYVKSLKQYLAVRKWTLLSAFDGKW